MKNLWKWVFRDSSVFIVAHVTGQIFLRGGDFSSQSYELLVKISISFFKSFSEPSVLRIITWKYAWSTLLRFRNKKVRFSPNWKLSMNCCIASEKSRAAEVLTHHRKNKSQIWFCLRRVPCPSGYRGFLKGRWKSSVILPITLPPMKRIIPITRCPVFCNSTKIISLILHKRIDIFFLFFYKTGTAEICVTPLHLHLPHRLRHSLSP